MPTIKAHGVSGQQSAHDLGNRAFACPKQKVKVVGDQSPCKTDRSGFCQYFVQTIQEIIPVSVIVEYLPTLDTPYDYMVEGTRCINS